MDCMPRYDQAFSGACEQNLQDTMQLKQKFFDGKNNKRVSKAKDKKDGIQSSVHVQQKFLKRSGDELDSGNPIDNFEPPVKLQCTTQQHGSNQNEGLTKFSVEIVQQLEFTTSAANSQPQQISTNVTVKTHANASVKSDISSPKAPTPGTPGHTQKANIGLDVGTLVECVKQEPDNDFADLDQCAEALEKDAAANGGAGFGASFPDLMGDDTNDEIMSSAAFKDLISDISNYSDYPDFDFEDKPANASSAPKTEDKSESGQQGQPANSEVNKPTQSPHLGGQSNFSPPVFEKNPASSVNARLPYANMDFGKTELSPAAQTLKQMAEQHQHKNQMGLNFNPANRAPNARSPYSDFQFQSGDYSSPGSNPNFHKNSPGFPQPDMIKQEMIYQGNEFNDMKRKNNPAAGVYQKQSQYSPYGSPGPGGSPGFLNSGRGGSCPPPNSSSFGGGTPPRPPSGSGNGGGQAAGTTSVQINQAQQLNINQHGPIQVSAGQHLHLSADVKGNVSIATQQGMQFTHGGGAGDPQGGASNAQHSPMGPAPHQGGSMPNGAQATMNQNASQMGPNVNPLGPQMGSAQMGGQPSGLGGMQNPGSAMGGQPGMQGAGGLPGGPGGLSGMMGGPNMSHGNVMGGHVDSYSMSQTQTINFTQQTLRRGAGPGGMGGPMGGQMGPMGARMMSAQVLEQQKMQQQMFRAQQQAMQQQQQQLRPPPPDYKTSAGLSQGMQPRYGAPAPPPSMRRLPHQPIPPSGPMIRSNMYMMQQQPQQISGRAMYARQPGPMGGMDAIQQNSSDWRHLLMSQQQQQQQSANFGSMRPGFQGNGFNMAGGSMQQMTAMHQQQQHMRAQQAGLGGGQTSMSHVMGGGQGGPMAQMNSMNQAVLHMQQQQQQSMMQQQQPQSAQMSMSSIHMQQSQSISVNSQSLHQQQQQQGGAGMIGGAAPNVGGNSLVAFNPQAATEFNFEFLDNLAGAADTAQFTDQELLNSFDTDAAFNLDF